MKQNSRKRKSLEGAVDAFSQEVSVTVKLVDDFKQYVDSLQPRAEGDFDLSKWLSEEEIVAFPNQESLSNYFSTGECAQDIDWDQVERARELSLEMWRSAHEGGEA